MGGAPLAGRVFDGLKEDTALGQGRIASMEYFAPSVLPTSAANEEGAVEEHRDETIASREGQTGGQANVSGRGEARKKEVLEVLPRLATIKSFI